MIIPSQYNGFDYQGRRVYNVGGGVGEAMLISAAIGGGTSALRGQDPLKGALLGGALGGLGAGAMGALGGGAGGAGAGEALASGVGAGSAAASSVPGWVQSSPGFFELASEVPKSTGIMGSALNFAKDNPLLTAGGLGLAGTIAADQRRFKVPRTESYSGPLSFFKYDPRLYSPDVPVPPNPPYRAQYAEGGITALAQGGAPTGPVERLSQNVIGAGGMYPQSQMDKTYFATPTQMPASAEVIAADYDTKTNPYTGAMMASGGIADLGSYSDGGRLLKGPGDGMSDSIPAKIGSRQPARLADGEFVVPADVVSHLGNGSTDAGAKQLYSMMDRVRKTRTGTKKQGKQINPGKYVPA